MGGVSSPHYQGSSTDLKPRDFLNWPLGQAAGDLCPRPPSSPERIVAPPTGKFQIAGGRKGDAPGAQCGRSGGLGEGARSKGCCGFVLNRLSASESEI